MNTEQQIRNQLEVYLDLHNTIKEIAHEYFEIKNGRKLDDLFSIDILDNDVIEIEGSIDSHCSCCGDESQYFSFPLSYLWNPNWQEELQKQKMKDNLAAIAKKQAEDEKRKLEQETADYKQYIKLKEKFNSWGE
jgi:hypothetical protein